MDGYGYGHGVMWIGWLLLAIGIVVFLGFVLRGPWSGWRSDDQERRGLPAREILDQRFARGEITKEQYEDMRRTLEQ
jgi:putative membrane protein